MIQPPPTEGQFFTLQPVQPKPKPAMSWGLPLTIGLLAIPLLMFGFGFSQQQPPTPAANASATPMPEQANSLNVPTPEPEAAPTSTPPAEAVPQLNDVVRFPIARIQSPGMAANFRAAPTLQSQVLGVLLQGDLVELSTERRVEQDGVVWVPVRFRGQSGWLANNFLGGQTDAQP